MKKLTQTWKIQAYEKAKARFDVCQADCGENKLDRLPRDLEREKRNSDVYPTECRKGNADDYLVLEKSKSKRNK